VSVEATVPEVLWPLVVPEVVEVSVDCWPCVLPLVEAVPASEPLVLSEPEADVEPLVVSVLDEVEVLGDDEVEDVVPAMLWSCCEERCAVCELWSGDVVLEVELVEEPLVEPVEATELLWPVVSVDCALLELGLVLAVDELGEDEDVLEGVED
jgi:hypothetical protein